jgi:hypothetical protein
VPTCWLPQGGWRRRHASLRGARGRQAVPARRRAASRRLKTQRNTARRMEGAGGASTRAAPSRRLQAARRTVRRMAGAGAARRRAAPSRLKAAARSIARRMAGASAVRSRAAPRQSLKLPAAWSARCVGRLVGGPPTSSSTPLRLLDTCERVAVVRAAFRPSLCGL